MDNQKDRHLEAPGEANRDKHINFLAEENGDIDPADEKFGEDDNKETGDDNGFFTDDDNTLQTKEEHDKDKGNHPGKNEKAVPLSPASSATLGDRITVNSDNEDLVTPVKDDDPDSYNNEDDQAH